MRGERSRTRARLGVLAWFLAFQAAAVLPVLLVGLSLQGQLRDQQVGETLRDGEVVAALLADLTVAPGLPRGDLRQASPAQVQAAVSRLVGSPAVDEQVLRFKVWDADGRVLASDDPSLVGQRFPVGEHLALALQGTASSELTTLEASENARERGFGRAVEVYAPLREDAAVLGAFEVYLPYEPLAAALLAQEEELEGDVLLGLVVVVVAIGLLTAGVTTLLRRRTARALHLAQHDQLTGLLGRLPFEALLHRDGLAPGAALVLVDLDGFQRVNDTLGRAGGDAVLRQVAAALSSAPGARHVARLSGDEFALVLDHGDPDGDVGLMTALHRLRDAVAVETEVAGLSVSPVASVGAAPADPAAGAGELLRRAATALRAAQASPAGAAAYDPALDPFDPDSLHLLAELRHAAERGQLVLHYQPQARPGDRRTAALEALLRWQHPVRGLLAPGAFLPLAETTGLVRDLTRWVLDAACGQLAAWDRAGVPTAVSVNVSALDVADRRFPAVVREAVARHGVAPARLCLELTETAIVADPVAALEVLSALAADGHELSLDDFGTGYTSLGQLRDLPLTEIKLDRRFVAGMRDNPADRAVVTTVLGLAGSLGLRLVAEGVETAEQLADLHALGCDRVQGYHLSRPVPAEAAAALLHDEAARSTQPA